ncbi:MAG: TIGR02206 family membrane protein [Anaerolineales bacterium]|nr:TIGR02206 family membrane protein [Anaerolineales bacterium]
MEEYFALNYSGSAFDLFGIGHLIALGLIVLLCISFLYFHNNWGEKEKKQFRYTMAIILFLNEIAWHIWASYWGVWTIQTMLPLHMCSVIVWLTMVMLITKSYPIYEVAYFLGIGGALQALLTPDITGYGFPHFRAFNTFIAHGLLVAMPIYMTLVEAYRPTLQSLKRVFIWTNLYMIPVFFLNLVIGSNYLFVAYKPNFPTLLDLLAPWPLYILQLELIGFAILFVLYIPFLIKDLRLKKQTMTT